VHGVQTLRQLLPAEIELRAASPGAAWSVPSVHIRDLPRFGWRGLLIDTSRFFASKAFVLRELDLLALYKISVLHLHLTDDQGWRVEIDPEYPWQTIGNDAPLFTRADIKTVSGDPKIYRHRSEGSGKIVNVNFCAACGTKLFQTFERYPDLVGVFAGTFDDPNWFERSPATCRHIFTRSAQIAYGLLLRRGRLHLGEQPRPQHLRQLAGVTPIGLHPVARLARDQGRRHHLAADPPPLEHGALMGGGLAFRMGHVQHVDPVFEHDRQRRLPQQLAGRSQRRVWRSRGSGRLTQPTAMRVWRPLSPNTSTMRLEAPLMTLG
jgi:hypothetical protein